jgi:hypothetical protein
MIVSPRGEVLGELGPGQTTVLRAVIEAEDVSNWYLGQRRRDVLQMRYHGGDAPAGGG